MNPRRGLSPLAVIAVLLAAPCSLRATDPGRIKEGDEVIVATPDTELYVNQQVAGRLDAGTKFKVVEVFDNWVGGMAVTGVKEMRGWVLARRLSKPDDPKAVAALKELKLRLETDRLGNVLRLDANDSAIEGKDLRHVRGLYNLEGLELSGTKIINDDLGHIGGLSNLQWLYLDKTKVSDDGLAHLSDLINLDVLALNDTKVEGPGLEHLKPLKKLRVLNLSNCKIADGMLKHLSTHGSIQTLALQGAPIDGTGLEHLKTMPRLNVINLNKCKLKSRTLLHLKDFQELRILHLEGATVPQADKDDLDEELPSLAIFDD